MRKHLSVLSLRGRRVLFSSKLALSPRQCGKHRVTGTASFLHQLSGPKMCAAAGFHFDQARWPVGEEGQHLSAFELLAQAHCAALINTMSLKHILCF
jgi:hypothetical protein